jgi:hypothetical protein
MLIYHMYVIRLKLNRSWQFYFTCYMDIITLIYVASSSTEVCCVLIM